MTEAERLKRWRLLLGSEAEGSCGAGAGGLSGGDIEMDRALAALYRSDTDTRSGGLGGSAPKVARWLGDIRTYFPSSVVRVMQQDALERLNLQQMLLEPEMMQAVEADVHLVANLMSLSQLMPATTKETARLVVQKVVQVVTLLALNDDGAPCFDRSNAAAFATLGSPAFACTPDQFPDLMAATLSRQDIGLWAAKAGVATTRGV